MSAPGYDFPERVVTVDEVPIAYVDQGPPGEGRPLLLVHGLGATLDHWALAIPELARSRRVLALDLPGFGRSGKPDRSYDPQDFTSILAGFLDRLEVRQVDLVGHSMGGAVAAELALEHPSRVARLVLVDAAGMTRMPTRFLDFLVQRFEERVDPARVVLPPRLVRAMVKLIFYEPVPFAERNVGRILASMVEEDWPARVRSFVRAATGLSRAQVRERLGDLKLPTLVIWGEQDRLLPLRHGKSLSSGVATSRLVVFPRCGHCPMIEHPKDFADVVERFLLEGESAMEASG